MRKYTRGLPPPPTFSLAELADDALLTQKEVAAVKRQTVVATEKRRLDGTDDLEWHYIDGFPRCVAKSLKKKMTNNPTVRRPPVPRREEAAPRRLGSRQRLRDDARAPRRGDAKRAAENRALD